MQRSNLKNIFIAFAYLILALFLLSRSANQLALTDNHAPPEVLQSVLQGNNSQTLDHFTPPRVQPRLAPKTATFQVTYNPAVCGSVTPWPAEAQVAFEYALSIWETLIQSQVPIRVDACWQPLPGTALGSARATNLYDDFAATPRPNTWYVNALADALSGQDISPQETDIFANFNSSLTNWYFGTDGQVGASEFDFVTVVLHEVGHGLGLIGSMEQVTVPPSVFTQGFWGGGSGRPFAYDLLAEDVFGRQLTDQSAYQNPSTFLSFQLTGGNIFLDSPQIRGANNNQAAEIFAPNSWVQGASFVHIDEAIYSGTPNGLMTPSLNIGEAVHDPGPIAMAILESIGWSQTANSGPIQFDEFVYLPLVIK
ncbi:MAG: hypothetical protein AAF902_06120 [Chloroflexota bacterium]